MSSEDVQDRTKGAVENVLCLKVEALKEGSALDAEMSLALIRQLEETSTKPVLISALKNESKALCWADSTYSCPGDCIRLSAETMQNLHVEAGDLVHVKICSDIDYGSFVTVLSTDFAQITGQALTGQIVRDHYFKETQVPVLIGNRYSFDFKGQRVHFDVIDCHPEPYCMVAKLTQVKIGELNRSSEKKEVKVVVYDGYGDDYGDLDEDDYFSSFSEDGEDQDDTLEDIIQPFKSLTTQAVQQDAEFSEDSVNGYVPVSRFRRQVEPVVLNPRFEDPDLAFDYSFITPKDAYKFAIDSCERMKEYYKQNPDLKPDRDYDQMAKGFGGSLNDID